MWRRSACQTLSKALDMSSATAQVAPDLLKALPILSDTTVRRSAVDWEDIKPYWKSEKDHISLGDQQFYYYQVFQRLCQPQTLTDRAVVFSCGPSSSPTFLNTGATYKTFKQSRKEDSFRHLLKSSARM